uniref:Uncharacterized protein n=1 Tax=Oryza meridionalis TaxID=40149 RepID=A0A0E0CU59_9ORYZ
MPNCVCGFHIDKCNETIFYRTAKTSQTTFPSICASSYLRACPELLSCQTMLGWNLIQKPYFTTHDLNKIDRTSFATVLAEKKNLPRPNKASKSSLNMKLLGCGQVNKVVNKKRPQQLTCNMGNSGELDLIDDAHITVEPVRQGLWCVGIVVAAAGPVGGAVLDPIVWYERVLDGLVGEVVGAGGADALQDAVHGGAVGDEGAAEVGVDPVVPLEGLALDAMAGLGVRLRRRSAHLLRAGICSC